MVATIPNVDQVKVILYQLAVDFPAAYEEICKICDLLNLRAPPDPR